MKHSKGSDLKVDSGESAFLAKGDVHCLNIEEKESSNANMRNLTLTYNTAVLEDNIFFKKHCLSRSEKLNSHM